MIHGLHAASMHGTWHAFVHKMLETQCQGASQSYVASLGHGPHVPHGLAQPQRVAERVADGILSTWTLRLWSKIPASFIAAQEQTRYLNDAA